MASGPAPGQRDAPGDIFIADGKFVAGFSEGHTGLGILVLSTYRQLRTDLLFAAVVTAALLGLALFGAVNVGSSLLLRRFRIHA